MFSGVDVFGLCVDLEIMLALGLTFELTLLNDPWIILELKECCTCKLCLLDAFWLILWLDLWAPLVLDPSLSWMTLLDDLWLTLTVPRMILSIIRVAFSNFWVTLLCDPRKSRLFDLLMTLTSDLWVIIPLDCDVTSEQPSGLPR